MSKKKAAIITLYGNFNYGNKLQNYAVENFFMLNGIECYTLAIKQEIKGLKIKNLIKSIMSRNMNILRKEKIFEEFNEEYLHYDIFNKLSERNYAELNKKYDYFAVGSDQVWNPNYNDNLNYYYLMFTSKDKKIPISPSFGIPMKDEDNEVLTPYLDSFKYISCREANGASFIERAICKKCEVVIDPTLYFDKEFWEKIIKGVQVPSRYILAYFLGEVTEEYKKKLENIKTKLRCKDIIYINDESIELYDKIGPQQFLYLIYHSEVICTDSFHGSVFSFIFEKPLIIFNRVGETMFDRILTLATTFKFNNRLIENLNEDEILNCDYSKGKEILELKRNEFEQFILRFIE